jgi:hypothetical protein
MNCPQCDGQRWVCEIHPDQPWIGDRACQCGGAGMPCPACNSSDGLIVPEMPPGFIDEEDVTRH